MFSGQELPSEEVELFLQLIVFAKSNEFFPCEPDDEEISAYHSQLREVADELERRLTLLQESVGKQEERTVGELSSDREAVGIDFSNRETSPRASERATGSDLWWDLSKIKPGLTRDGIHSQVRQVVEQLRELSSCSDSLDDRRSLQEALYLLKPMTRNVP